MSMIPRGPGGGGKPYTGDNPIIPAETDISITKGTLLNVDLIIKAVTDDVRHGRYMWKKYECKEIIGVLSAILDLEDFTTDSYDCNIYEKIIVENGIIKVTGRSTTITVYLYDGGNQITDDQYPYFEYNGYVYTDVTTSRNGTAIQGKLLSQEKGDYITSVVSDNQNKYPDDGPLNGHYYEKARTSIEEFGIDFGYVIYPTNTFTPTVEVATNLKGNIKYAALILMSSSATPSDERTIDIMYLDGKWYHTYSTIEKPIPHAPYISNGKLIFTTPNTDNKNYGMYRGKYLWFAITE